MDAPHPPNRRREYVVKEDYPATHVGTPPQRDAGDPRSTSGLDGAGTQDSRGIKPRRASQTAGPRARTREGAEGFADEVRQLWAARHGWAGKWPRERRHDAILIGQAIRRYHLPIEFWRALIDGVPLGATWHWLSERGPRSGVSRLQDAADQWQTEAARQRRGGGLLQLGKLGRAIVGAVRLRRMDG